ncbi:nuclear transport factor 2 family protein [Homoserinibacter sp. YIM 151385]|uniref:nuclear transport factor 2 family protein n=1 Tax=Homoserinibacter sp. YIM 151385 TaxID=2985506 RepID=UPI0022F0052B|nr:nuclear transport factor 2 family protein [Homoserinibacter sp. YIM 151385]WBU36907.1 nuclear transport factor 2 family protein [Homoserinibacter sp. YIM 151385]
MTTDTDRAEIIELFGRYADIADLKDFDELPPLVHTDPFTMDFESVTGMPPQQTTLADYVTALSGAFAPFDATHHAITGHVVEVTGDRATAHAQVRAEHWVPRELAEGGPNRWLVVGHYDNDVVRTAHGWRFSTVRLAAAFQENAHLIERIHTDPRGGDRNV